MNENKKVFLKILLFCFGDSTRNLIFTNNYKPGIVKGMAYKVLHNTLCKNVFNTCKTCKMFETSKSFFLVQNFFFWTQNDFLLICLEKNFLVQKFFSGPKLIFC